MIQNNYKRKEETIVRDKDNSEYTFFAETAHHRKTTVYWPNEIRKTSDIILRTNENLSKIV